jgi:FKBP-type peptidyl-prolyl cis-trans isomerase SlyD
MQISKDTVVSLHYKLQVQGQEIDASQDKPLEYLHGHGMMITGFEKQLEGLSAGDNYDFKVKPSEGYGEFDQNAIVDLDKNIFLVDGTLSDQVFEGAQLQMTDQNGQRMPGTVLEVGEKNVKMDFNHQLAGQELHFLGNIVSVRQATDTEISHGHVH